MSHIPDDLRYSREHLWCREDPGGLLTIGLTDFAQEQLSEVLHIDLPDAGETFEAGDPMGEIESSKSVADIPAPVAGSCAEVNSECKDNPAAVNQDPYGEGWLLMIEPQEPAEFESLMAPDEYEAFCAEESERTTP